MTATASFSDIFLYSIVAITGSRARILHQENEHDKSDVTDWDSNYGEKTQMLLEKTQIKTFCHVIPQGEGSLSTYYFHSGCYIFHTKSFTVYSTRFTYSSTYTCEVFSQPLKPSINIVATSITLAGFLAVEGHICATVLLSWSDPIFLNLFCFGGQLH